MEILIAGGSGLIGQAVTDKLIKNGHRVWILTRNPANLQNDGDFVRYVLWDGKTPAGWGKIVNDMDAIVNLAGAPLNGEGPFDIWLTNKRKKLLLESRLDTTKALLDAVAEAETRPSVFLQGSAIGYYGPRGSEVIDESGSAGNDFLASVQIQAEQASERAVELGLRRIVVRTGLVLDKKEGALQYFKFQTALFAGGRMGNGKQYYSWVHIDDEAKAICFLLEHKDAAGIFNLTAPNPVTNQVFAKTIARVMRRPSFFIVPNFLLKLVLGEISTVILDGQRVLPEKLQALGYEFSYPELEQALADVV